MSVRVGKYCSIILGTFKLAGMGKWSIPGAKADLIENTAFGQEFKTRVMGLQDGGTIAFSGNFDSEDSQGQASLRTANVHNSQITNMKFFIDSTSGFVLDMTSYPNAYLQITEWKVDADITGVLKTDFSATVNGGDMVLV